MEQPADVKVNVARPRRPRLTLNLEVDSYAWVNRSPGAAQLAVRPLELPPNMNLRNVEGRVRMVSSKDGRAY